MELVAHPLPVCMLAAALGVGPAPVSTSGPPPCLRDFPRGLSGKTTVVVTPHSGLTLTGRFLSYDRNGAALWLAVPEPGTDRSRAVAVTGQNLAALTLFEEKESALFPLFGAVVLGLTGFVVGAEIGEAPHEDEVFPPSHYRDPGNPAWAYALGGAGLLLGAVGGAALAPSHTVRWDLECRP